MYSSIAKQANEMSDSFDSSGMLTIRVGDEPGRRDFVVHECFLVSRSEFFRRSMNGKWEESESKVVNLLDDEPDIFSLYMSLVYTGKLPIKHEDSDDLPQEKKKEMLEEQYDRLFHLYVLSEKLQDPAAKDASTTAIFEIFENEKLGDDHCLPTFSTMSMVFECTPEGCPARRLVVDLSSTCSVKALHSEAGSLPKDFVRDLLVSLRLRAKGRNIAKKNGVEAYLEKLIEEQQNVEA